MFQEGDKGIEKGQFGSMFFFKTKSYFGLLIMLTACLDFIFYQIMYMYTFEILH